MTARYAWSPRDLPAVLDLRVWRDGKNRPLTGVTLRLYGKIIEHADRHTGEWQATKLWMASRVGCKKRAADLAVLALMFVGVLEVVHQRDGQRQAPNLYRLRPRSLWHVMRHAAQAAYRENLQRLLAHKEWKRQQAVEAGRFRLQLHKENARLRAEIQAFSQGAKSCVHDLTEPYLRYGNADFEADLRAKLNAKWSAEAEAAATHRRR